MTPERWQQISRIYADARLRAASDRAAFLAEACAGDRSLQGEVQALLDQPMSHEGLDGLTPSVIAETMGNIDRGGLTGRRFGVYLVGERIGIGGMGEVYRARDTKLPRDVAIKVLPLAFAADADRLARFEREARVLASLDHPHIGTILGVEESDGIRALVLGFVDGETLAERIARGPIPLAEALEYARQIAGALEAAHEKGVVHRDLKPSNIKVTPAGVVKVLDFGLAKTEQSSSSEVRDAVTVTSSGVVLGTVAYMSPEQARGQAVDKRADIWAFGCVLYEMLTGRDAFARATPSDTVAAILDQGPDLRALPANTPPGLLRLLQRCLEKDPRRRLRDIGEARFEIEDSRDHAAGPARARGAARPLGRPAAWAVVRVLLNVTRVSAAAILLPMTFAAVGGLTSLVFNRALRVPSTEGFFDDLTFGYRALIAPASYSMAGALVLIVVVTAMSLLAWIAARLWPENRWRRKGRRATTLAIRWLADREPRALGQAFSALCGLALLAFTAVSWRLLSVIARLMVHGPAAGIDTSVLSLSSEPYLDLVSKVGSAMLFGLFTIWLALFPWLRQRGADAWVVRLYQWRSLAGILALLLLLSAPWRIAWNHDREPVQFDGRPGFLLTDRGSRVVIYVTGQAPVEVALLDPRLVRPSPATLRSIF